MYFIFAHPAIIYYNTPSSTNLADKDPSLALFYLTIAIVGWALVLIFLAFGIYKSTFGQRKSILKLLREGRSVSSTIVKTLSSKPGKNKTIQQEFVVSFTNFAKQEVQYTLVVNDSKPEMKRYEVGGKLRLCIDESIRIPPYILPEDTQVKISIQKVILFYGLWALLTVGIIAYFFYAYQTESQGYGWRFMVIYHPLLLSMFTIVGLGTIAYFLIFKLFVPKMAGIKNNDKIALLLYGHKTMATVEDVTQTGTYINEQPEIKFTLSYTDGKGNVRQVSTKKIVRLINLHQVQQSNRTIFYLPDSPDVVAFEEDIQS